MRTLLSLTLLLTIGCAANPRPGDAGYPYNLEGPYGSIFSLQGTTYEGSARLQTLPDGTVEGEFTVTTPLTMQGRITGTVSADHLAISGSYRQERGCEGTVTGTGTIDDGGGVAQGALRVEDTCGGVLEGTFRFTREAASGKAADPR